MTKRETVLVAIIATLALSFLIVVMSTRCIKHTDNNHGIVNTNSSTTKEEKSKQEFLSGLSKLTLEVTSLKERIGALETEVAALKLDPRSEDKIIESMSNVDNSWDSQKNLSDDIEKLSPEKSYELFTKVWPTLESDRQKRGLLRTFSRGKHHHLMDILDFGINDPSLEIQKSALQLLRYHTLMDFTEDFTAYDEWRKETIGKSLDEVVEETLTNKFEEAHQDSKTLEALLESASRPPLKSHVSADKALSLCEYALENGTPEAVRYALQYISLYQGDDELSEEYLRSVVLPIITTPDELIDNSNIRNRAMGALTGKNNLWATDVLIGLLDQEFKDKDTKKSYYSGVARAIEKMNDYSAIPRLIEVIKRDPEDGVYDIGYFGLSRMTGVEYDKSHDGEWWDQWWERNKSRFVDDIDTDN